jgi:hypothetical protein
VHQADPRPAVGQLAVAAVDLAPGPEQIDDRGVQASRPCSGCPPGAASSSRPASRRMAQ